MPIQVNLQTRVNAAAIRRETDEDGREYLVLPSFTLPANVVMNGGLYPAAQIDAHYKKLEGTLAPLGHPTVNGKFVSAFSPEGINRAHIGAFNRNVKKVGNRISVEKWIDIEVAERSEGGKRVLERGYAAMNGEEIEPIHTSVAVFLDQMPAPSGSKYNWVANIHDMDHDAILLDQPGAATPKDGVGMFVNADDAQPVIATNAGAMEGETYRDKERLIQEAATARWAAPGSGDQYVWVTDFTDAQVVVIRNGGVAELYDYTRQGDVITFGNEGTAVSRKETWVEKGKAAMNKALRAISLFNNQAPPDNPEGAEMPITAEERAAIAKDTVDLLGPMVKANLAEALQPLSTEIESLKANQKSIEDAVTANSRAAETEKRAAVEAKFGKVVADALTGNALDEMFAKCGDVEGLNTNGSRKKDDPLAAPAADSDYFGKE